MNNCLAMSLKQIYMSLKMLAPFTFTAQKLHSFAAIYHTEICDQKVIGQEKLHSSIVYMQSTCLLEILTL